MQAAHCPVCHEFVGYVPDDWTPHVTHHGVRHSLTVDRPTEDDPNPD